MDFKRKKKERELQRLKSWRHSKKDNKKILKFSSKLLSIAFEKVVFFVFCLLLKRGFAASTNDTDFNSAIIALSICAFKVCEKHLLWNDFY